MNLLRAKSTLVLATAVLAFKAAPVDAKCGKVCQERVARKQCSQTRVLPCLHRAALTHRVSYSLLRSISFCESRFNPFAHNASGSSGLMQFLPSTFADTHYWRHSIFSAKWNALAGGLVLREQGTTPWISSRPCWGS